MIELGPEECAQLLEEGRVAHIGCLSDGEVYVTPMSYVMIDGTMYFRTVPGRRTRALRENPHVCVEVSRGTGDDGWESVLFWGDAEFVADESREAEVVAALLRKYHAESALGTGQPRILPKETPVISIAPDRMEGRASGGGLSTPTRPGRL